MESNKKYIYAVLMQNSKSFWKFLIGYVILLLILFGVSDFYYDFSTVGFILTIIYIVFLWIITIWTTVYYLKKLFTGNRFFNLKIFDNENKTIENEDEEAQNNISKLSENIEEQFIKYWYNEISRNEKFPCESRVIIENTLKTICDVMVSTDKKIISYAVGNIFLKHLKEFRRTWKLKEKNGAKITEIYRYSFSTLPTKKSQEYYVHQITKNLLVNFIHWELWNSIPCQLVVSIISRKLSFLMDMCANPDFLNYYMLKTFILESDKNSIKLDEYAYVRIEVTEKTIEHPKKKISRIIIEEERISTDETVTTNVEIGDGQTMQSPEEVSTLAVPDKPNSPQKPEEKIEVSFTPCENLVKVYEPKSASKTWNEALDLGSISMGEDPLKSSLHSDPSLAVHDLQDVSEADSSHEDREVPHLNNNNKTLLDEVKHMTSMEGLKNTMKPFSDATVNTLRDIKDFQENTVNSVVKPMSHATSQALHKMSDLQDEAAGVVEGLFDFGLAGIRKGLKLTGLQEQEGVSDNKMKNLLGSPGVKAQKKLKRLSKAELAEECIWLNPLQNNPSFDDDATADNGKDLVPSITMDSSEYESPDPEYEEAADLASTIAKLRSLLQQKSSESASTTPAASPMVVEDSKSMMDMDDVDSFVPSFYKLCAKTATGVFNNTLNTIKTALPVNANEMITYDTEKWDYEQVDDKDLNLLIRMNKLLHDRQDFCMIETAYDAFDSQLIPEVKKRVSNINYQDEFDELEAKVPLAKTLLDIICELIADSDTFISQEPFVKFILLVLGQSIDEIITTNIGQFLDHITITEISLNSNQEVLSMELDVFIDYLISGIPDAFTFFIGHSTVKEALNILVSSIQMKKCNQDIILQIFELIALRLKDESMKNNTVYSTL